MGTPVVTADVGGQKELVDNTCGRVVENIQTAKNGMYNRNYEQEEIERYTRAIEEVLNDKNIKNNCRNKILNGFTVDNMVKKFEKEFEDFAKNGTSINPLTVTNKDLYKQYIVLYNQIDVKNYFPQEGGNNFEFESLKNYKISMLKGKLWQNPFYRGFIKFLQAIGFTKLIKKTGLKAKIRKII